jgi:hypothetical protein
MDYAILFAVMGTAIVWLYHKYRVEHRKFLVVSSMLHDLLSERVTITHTNDGFEIKAKNLNV